MDHEHTQQTKIQNPPKKINLSENFEFLRETQTEKW